MKNKWIRLVTVMAATLIIMLAGRGISLIFSPEPAEKGVLLRGVLAAARHSPTPVAGPAKHTPAAILSSASTGKSFNVFL